MAESTVGHESNRKKAETDTNHLIGDHIEFNQVPVELIIYSRKISDRRELGWIQINQLLSSINDLSSNNLFVRTMRTPPWLL
jgi:hypothetical protein